MWIASFFGIVTVHNAFTLKTVVFIWNTGTVKSGARMAQVCGKTVGYPFVRVASAKGA